MCVRISIGRRSSVTIGLGRERGLCVRWLCRWPRQLGRRL